MAGRADLGGVAHADGDAGRICAEGRTDLPEGHHADAELCGGAHAVRETVFAGGRGAHRATDRGEGFEFGRGGCSGDDARARGVLQEREPRGAGALYRAVFAARLERATVFVVDDFDAASLPE